MRILWDFRLFSFGYASRGIGTYVLRMAEAILREHSTHTFVILADRTCLPEETKTWPVIWIPYKKSSWKHSLISVPLLILKHHIECIHYWVALGPIHAIGMGCFHPCPVMATVYDLAVELWDDVPFAESKKQTWYWNIQKILIQQSSIVHCISQATASDVTRVFHPKPLNTRVIYVPQKQLHPGSMVQRKSYFITLGGSVHKNLQRVINAFMIFKEKNKEYQLIVLGEIDKAAELPSEIPAGVLFENMTQYALNLTQASGVVICSLHEGLGLPAIEAMTCHCPLLLADIPSLREISDECAVFVNPHNTSDIAQGMQQIIDNQARWIKKSAEAMARYAIMSKEAGSEMVTMYQECKQKRCSQTTCQK